MRRVVKSAALSLAALGLLAGGVGIGAATAEPRVVVKHHTRTVTVLKKVDASACSDALDEADYMAGDLAKAMNALLDDDLAKALDLTTRVGDDKDTYDQFASACRGAIS